MQHELPDGMRWEDLDVDLMVFHEAGHAVVGGLVGRHLEAVMLVTPDGKPAGCRFADGEPDLVPPLYCPPSVADALVSYAISQAAGHIAEQIGTGRRFPKGTEYDVAQMIACYWRLFLCGAVTGSQQEFFRDVQERALAILRENWTAVQSVANELKVNRYLSGDDVRKMIGEAQSASDKPIDKGSSA